MINYTKGEWTPYQLKSNNVSICVKTEGDLVAVEIASLNTLLGYDTVVANANRIAALHNACEGLNPEGIKPAVEALEAITSQFQKMDKLYSKDKEIINKAEQALKLLKEDAE